MQFSVVGLLSGNKVSQNTFKNTPEDDLDKFCDIISHLTSKYRPDFLGLRKLLGRTSPDFDEHYYIPNTWHIIYDVYLTFFLLFKKKN